LRGPVRGREKYLYAAATNVEDLMVDACLIELAPETSTDDFRGAMRHLVGAVSVITAGRGNDITGMTVTSVSSLSLEPPTLIVSINRVSSTWPVLRRFGVFGVNVLTSDQIDVAERFSGKNGLKGRERFAGGKWIARGPGAPLLVGAAAAIDCEVEDVIERHSHAIVIGRVRDLTLSKRESALAYWHGRYVAVDRDEDISRLAAVGVPYGARSNA
jgi:flavin reductase (DIM6/NTAB) family NADH-FMN oxidoreductase RutF